MQSQPRWRAIRTVGGRTRPSAQLVQSEHEVPVSCRVQPIAPWAIIPAWTALATVNSGSERTTRSRRAAAASPLGVSIAAVSDRPIRVWSTATGSVSPTGRAGRPIWRITSAARPMSASIAPAACAAATSWAASRRNSSTVISPASTNAHRRITAEAVRSANRRAAAWVRSTGQQLLGELNAPLRERLSDPLLTHPGDLRRGVPEPLLRHLDRDEPGLVLLDDSVGQLAFGAVLGVGPLDLWTDRG